MPRIRTIKPEFWSDEKLAPLPPTDRLVFVGLWSFADDAGRIVDSVKAIDGFIFSATEDTVGPSLDRLEAVGRIDRGTTASGQNIIQIVNWKHQKIDKPNLAAALPPIAIRAESTINRRKLADQTTMVFDRRLQRAQTPEPQRVEVSSPTPPRLVAEEPPNHSTISTSTSSTSSTEETITTERPKAPPTPPPATPPVAQLESVAHGVWQPAQEVELAARLTTTAGRSALSSIIQACQLDVRKAALCAEIRTLMDGERGPHLHPTSAQMDKALSQYVQNGLSNDGKYNSAHLLACVRRAMVPEPDTLPTPPRTAERHGYSGNGALRSPEPISASTTLANHTGSAKKVEDERELRKRYETEQFAAARQWSERHPEDAKLVIQAANEHLEALGPSVSSSNIGKRSRDKEIVAESAKRAGFPLFEEWQRRHSGGQPDPLESVGVTHST